MFKWKKLGKVFDPTQYKREAWLDEFAQAPCVLEFDDFIRVYFSCRPKPDEKGQYVSYSSYVDLKKKTFEVIQVAKNPILSLGKLGAFDEFGIYPVSVIRDSSEVLAYYAGWTRCESTPFNVAIGVAKSLDNGISFERLGDGPVLSYSPDEPFILSGPKIRKYGDTYCLWYIAGREWISVNGKKEPIYKIRMATSKDGLNWIKINKDIISDSIGKEEAQASPDVIYENGKYHMFFCYRHATDYRRNRDRTYKIGYAYSDDMFNWVRDDSKVGISISQSGWDDEMLAYPHVYKLEGKIYMFYLGNEVGRYGFGMAQLEGELI